MRLNIYILRDQLVLNGEKMKVDKSGRIEVKVWVNKEVANLFKELARDHGMTRSEMFGDLLTQYIAERVS